MSTIRDVARAAGVSVASASRALNGHSNVTPAMREKVQRAAQELRYVPHSGARSLTRRKTDTIGVILPDLFGEFFSELVRGIDLIAHRSGLHLLLSNMRGSAYETASAVQAMRGRIDGLLFMPPNANIDELKACLDGVTPTVLLNYQDPALNLPCVTIDNYAGAYAMTQHLVEQGYQKIVHICGPAHNFDARERLRGFRDALREHAGQRNPMILPGDFTEEGGKHAADMLVSGKTGFDAVFAANDVMAVGCIAELEARGMRVPHDAAVSGFDDIPLARHIKPQLTTMQVHIDRLGSTAMLLLLRMLGGETLDASQSNVSVPSLIVRGSTGQRDAAKAPGASD
ncbi:MAG: LacI family transcriptional regulator [Sphingomonas sp.]|nr:LacI family transcriptional regulator [Sphingomonas sp.]|tara:strand:- start:449 stop:1474 length:1026 start_codon:yes stop_codon:yes gene_type:complete